MIINNKIIFRFFFILSCLLVFPFPININSKFELPNNLVTSVYDEVIPWFGKNILRLDYEIATTITGSGDTAYYYIQLLIFVALAFIGTIIWSFLAKKEKSYEKLNYIFEVVLRYFLAAMMLTYGLAKVFPLQMPEPSFYKLLKPLGESSPMGLVWAFMGSSKGYLMFSGIMETLGGLLLFHKRTKLIGALLLLPVLANVVALNFFYDVPVKLFSVQLLIFAILIVLPDFKRLSKAIFSNSSIEERKIKTNLEKGDWRKKKIVLKWLFVFLIVFSVLSIILENNKLYGPNAPKPELYGLYEVSHFIVNKDTVQPMLKDTISWRYIAIERPESIQIYQNNMTRIGFESKVDTIAKEIFMKSYKDSTNAFTLMYVKTDTTLTVSGAIKNDSILMTTKRLDKKDFLLMNRGFRWINERPYNR